MMATPRVSSKDLRRELNDVHAQFPKLADDELFVLWFLRAYVTDDLEGAAKALTGGAGDKGVDAVFIDENARQVFVIQGKYSQKVSAKTETHSDVLSFAYLAEALWGGAKDFAPLRQGMSPEVEEKLKTARDRLKRRRYRLKLFYVTMGKCSPDLQKEAALIVRKAGGPTEFAVLPGNQVLLLLSDYLDGVAPPVPSLELELETGHGTGALQRYDPATGIDTWVCSMTCTAVAKLYEQAGIRLFARNVRGYLGSTDINRSMHSTIEQEPEYFWYYNNGVTMICDDAEQVRKGGRGILHVSNPQIINGQQTTRVLAAARGSRKQASVLVRVIKIPRQPADRSEQFERLVSAIVAATNWQNAIQPSDLMANDRRQVEIERELRKLGYLYLRKRQTKGEARRAAGNHYHFFVKKEELARAVAGCDLDPSIPRRGVQRLFEEPLYNQAFPNSDPAFYLPRFWLMRMVSRASRGYPERAYAKWAVLNFLWTQLSRVLRSNERVERFRRQCERNGPVVKPLLGAANSAFAAMLRFYRANRGTGAKAIDVSTFFQRTELDKQFKKYWRGPSVRGKGALKGHLGQIEKFVRAD